MTKGKAHGQNLAYQTLCKDIIRQLQKYEALTPYEGDGIDVSIQICGTTVTFDVVLKNAKGSVVAVESRRYKERIKQEAVFAFAKKVECLREELGVDVAGILMARKNYQRGAIRAAKELGIELAICEQDQAPDSFVISYKRYDPQRDAINQDVMVHPKPVVARATASLGIVVIRADGTREDHGETT